MKEIPEIIEYWKQSAVNLNKGVDLEPIEMLEQKINRNNNKTFTKSNYYFLIVITNHIKCQIPNILDYQRNKELLWDFTLC